MSCRRSLEYFGMVRAAILYVFDNPRQREHLLLSDTEEGCETRPGKQNRPRAGFCVGARTGSRAKRRETGHLTFRSTRPPPARLNGRPLTVSQNNEEEKDALEETREDVFAKAHELIKDQILRLSDSDLVQLTAALLRAMGYRTRVSPPGPDRGVDIFASPDGLGFQEPRIKVQVKHRSNTPMGPRRCAVFLG
jgi:hypothetical protein